MHDYIMKTWQNIVLYVPTRQATGAQEGYLVRGVLAES